MVLANFMEYGFFWRHDAASSRRWGLKAALFYYVRQCERGLFWLKKKRLLLV